MLHSWLIHTELEPELYRDWDKIALHNIMWTFSHYNLSCICTCAHTLALGISRSRPQSRYSLSCVMKPSRLVMFYPWFIPDLRVLLNQPSNLDFEALFTELPRLGRNFVRSHAIHAEPSPQRHSLIYLVSVAGQYNGGYHAVQGVPHVAGQLGGRRPH